MITVVELDMPCHVAVTLAVVAVGPQSKWKVLAVLTVTLAVVAVGTGESVTFACPLVSVFVAVDERLPASVANVTGVLATGIPSRSMVAVIVEVIVELAAIVVGDAETVIVASAMFMVVDWVWVPHVAVMVTVPVVVPGTKVTVAYP